MVIVKTRFLVLDFNNPR